MLQLQQKVRKKMKGRKIRIRQGVKGWLLALAMVLSLCSGWKQDVCAQQSQSSSSNLMQDVDTDKKGSIEILFDTMRDEPVANAEFTLYQVAAMVDRGGYTVLELTGGFDGCGVQLKNLTAQQSKDASAALLEYQRANHISGGYEKNRCKRKDQLDRAADRSVSAGSGSDAEIQNRSVSGFDPDESERPAVI